MKITLDQAEAVVAKRKDTKWDGWTIVQDSPNNAGWLRPDGVFDHSTRRWMVRKRYELQPDGTYNVPKVFGNGL